MSVAGAAEFDLAPGPRAAISLARRRLRMARVGDLALLDHPADATGPRWINCYFVAVEEAVSESETVKTRPDGKKVKIDPQRLLYSVQWRHTTAATTRIRLRLMFRYAPDSGAKANIAGLLRWATAPDIS